MASLFHIAAEYRAQLEALSDLDLDPQTVADTVEGLSGDLENKLRAVIAYSLELDILSAGASDAAKRMADRAKSLQSRVEWLRRYVLDNMQATGIGEVATDEFSAKVAKSPPKVEIAEGAEIPLCFWRQPEPPAPTVDKIALRDALKGGREIPGASLVQGYRLAIR